jgi:hypothetical protein
MLPPLAIEQDHILVIPLPIISRAGMPVALLDCPVPDDTFLSSSMAKGCIGKGS